MRTPKISVLKCLTIKASFHFFCAAGYWFCTHTAPNYIWYAQVKINWLYWNIIQINIEQNCRRILPLSAHNSISSMQTTFSESFIVVVICIMPLSLTLKEINGRLAYIIGGMRRMESGKWKMKIHPLNNRCRFFWQRNWTWPFVWWHFDRSQWQYSYELE